MRIAVLGSTGGTGRALVAQALERGYDVVAIARDPAQVTAADGRLQVVRGDVTDVPSIAAAIDGADVVVSGLGLRKGQRPGLLTTGIESLRAAGAGRVVWLGALGTGPSAAVAGGLWRRLLPLVIGAQLPDKVQADETALGLGAAVFHAGPLTNGPLSPTRRTVTLDGVPRSLLPKGVSRATVAAQMLDEAEQARYGGRVVVPLS